MLLYIAVIKNNIVITEFSNQTGDFSDVAIKLLNANYTQIKGKTPNNETNFFIVPYDKNNFSFYYLINKEYVLVTLAGNCKQTNDYLDETAENSCLINKSKMNESYVENNSEKIILYLETLTHNIDSEVNLNNQQISLANPNKHLNSLIKSSFYDFNSITSENSMFSENKFQKIEEELELIKQEKLDILNKFLLKELDIDAILEKSQQLKISSWNIKQTIRYKNNKVKRSNIWSTLIIVFFSLIICILLFLNYESIINMINSINRQGVVFENELEAFKAESLKYKGKNIKHSERANIGNKYFIVGEEDNTDNVDDTSNLKVIKEKELLDINESDIKISIHDTKNYFINENFKQTNLKKNSKEYETIISKKKVKVKPVL